MILDRLFNFFYQRSVYDLIRWCIIAVLGVVFLHRRYRNQRWWKPMVVGSLLVWAMVVLYSTLLGRGGGGDFSTSLIPFHSYWKVLNGGSRELLRSNFMNLLLFYPAGILLCLLLPSGWPAGRRLAVTAMIFGCLSLSIETAQYVLSLGHFEADDILHNTLGAVIGCVSCHAAWANTAPVLR